MVTTSPRSAKHGKSLEVLSRVLREIGVFWGVHSGELGVLQGGLLRVLDVERQQEEHSREHSLEHSQFSCGKESRISSGTFLRGWVRRCS